MSEDTQSTDTGDTEVTETLDDVISEYTPPQVQAAPQGQQQPASNPPSYQAPEVEFDPLDESSAKRFASAVNNGQSVLSSQIRELNEKLTQYEQREAESRIETEIQQAVSQVNDGLNLDPDVVRTYLEYMASKKQGFKSIWDNRHQDPKTYKRALSAISKEMANKFSAKQDHELTQTQAAIQQSQRSMASRTNSSDQNPFEEALSKATGAEFDRLWRQALR